MVHLDFGSLYQWSVGIVLAILQILVPMLPIEKSRKKMIALCTGVGLLTFLITTFLVDGSLNAQITQINAYYVETQAALLTFQAELAQTATKQAATPTPQSKPSPTRYTTQDIERLLILTGTPNP